MENGGGCLTQSIKILTEKLMDPLVQTKNLQMCLWQDGQQIEVQKMILAASSLFCERIHIQWFVSEANIYRKKRLLDQNFPKYRHCLN